MKLSWQVLLGAILIITGVFILADRIFGIDMWSYLWPLALILIGLLLILRPPHFTHSGNGTFIGTVEKSGDWQVTDSEFSVGLGDMDLDFTRANIPDGETRIKISGFIGEVTLTLPNSTGFEVVSNCIISEIKCGGNKQDGFLNAVHFESENVSTAAKKLIFDVHFFIAETSIKVI